MTGMVEILCHIVEIITKKEIEVTGPEKAQFFNPIFFSNSPKTAFSFKIFLHFSKKCTNVYQTSFMKFCEARTFLVELHSPR